MKQKFKILSLLIAFMFPLMAYADGCDLRYVEVTGTAELEIVPDEIHYEIEIKEYFKEEFQDWAKPEDYKTKVPLPEIERNLRAALKKSGIPESAIRTEDVGDNWRKEGQDFLVSKTFDITLTDFNQIDRILKNIDTKGVSSMRVGQLVNKDILKYHEKGKIQALQAAKAKAQYLVESMGQQLGPVLRIVELPSNMSPYLLAQSNVVSSEVGNYDAFRVIKRSYSITARFEIK